MAWTKVTMISEEFGDEIGSRYFVGGTVIAIGTRAKGQRKYFCQSDTPVTSNEALSASAGGVSVPAAGAAWSTARPSCRVRSRQVSRLTPYQYHVTASYADPTDGSSYESLLGQPARISTSDQEVIEDYTKDKGDPALPVLNTAGQPFDRALQRIGGFRVYTIKKYVTADTKADILAPRRTINDSSKLIDGLLHPAWSLVLTAADFEPVDDFYDATITIKYNVNLWIDKPLSYGFHYLDSGVLTEITVKGVDPQSGAEIDVPITKPWPLTEAGGKAASSTTAAFEMTFYPYSESDWSGVPLS